MTTYLSIIIPCYNSAAFIQRCYNSLQCLLDAEDVEFIFINDGSLDDTLIYLQRFAQLDTRVKVLTQSNQGVSTARNRGLAIAEGEYILLVDSDDYLLPNSVSIIRQNLSQHADILIPAVIFEGEQSIVAFPHIMEGTYSVQQLFSVIDEFPTAQKLVYRRDLIARHHISFDETIHVGEVYTFTIQCLSHANIVKVSYDYFYHYVMQSQSAIHHPNPHKDSTIVIALEKINQYGSLWSTLPSFQITLYVLVMCFTYEKYIVTGIFSHDATTLWTKVIMHPLFRSCLQSVKHSSRNQHQRYLVWVCLYLPPKISYICLYLYNKIKKNLRK